MQESIRNTTLALETAQSVYNTDRGYRKSKIATDFSNKNSKVTQLSNAHRKMLNATCNCHSTNLTKSTINSVCTQADDDLGGLQSDTGLHTDNLQKLQKKLLKKPTKD